MRRIRGGSGLGDAIYLRPFVEHFLKMGEQIEVCTAYGDVFAGLGGVTVSPHRRDNIDVVCHYVSGKSRPDTNQWQDICAMAGLTVPLSFRWTVRNQVLVKDLELMAAGRPIVMVHGGRAPMGRTDGFGSELLPKRAAFDAVMDVLIDCFTVEVGKDRELYPLRAAVDLHGRTSVSDLMDIASVSAGIVGQCGWVIPMAEAMDKPLMAVWSAHGMEHTRHPYIRSITPGKVLSKPTSLHVVDDWNSDRIKERVNAFRELLGSR